jgi:hypothetical protein
MSNLFLSGKRNGKILEDSLFFNEVEKARGGDPVAAKKVHAVLQAFVEKPKKILQKKMQAMTVSTDLPQIFGESFVITVDQTDFDLGYEQIFQDVPPTKGKNFWSVISGHTSVTFKKVAEGGKIETNGKTGDKTYFYVDFYGGAIGWTKQSLEFRDTYTMMQDAVFFRNKHFENKANVHYGVLQTAAAQNVATPYDTGTDGQLRRDLRTINKAIYDLTIRLKDKGYGNMAGVPVVIVASRALEDRINAALRASTDSMANGYATGLPMSAVQITSRPKRVVFTYNDAIALNMPIVCVPGITITKQDYMQPTTYTAQEDILSLNQAQSVWSCYGCGIGDSEQVQNFIMS